MKKHVAYLLASLVVALVHAAPICEPHDFVVYCATPSGIAATIQAKRMGLDVGVSEGLVIRSM